MNNRRLFPLKSAAGSLWQHWQEARIHLPILQGAFLYASGTHQSSVSISLGRALAIHIPTSKARQEKRSMHKKRDVCSTDYQYEQLDPLNSAASTVESQTERAWQRSVEVRLLIEHVRDARAESREQKITSATARSY